MRAHFGLPSVENEETEGRPPIHVKFEIPYFTVSGIQVSSVSLSSYGSVQYICHRMGQFSICVSLCNLIYVDLSLPVR